MVCYKFISDQVLKTENRLIYRTIVSCFDLSVAFLCKGIAENAFQQSKKQENKTTSNLD